MIEITITGTAAELVLGTYLPSDKTIFNNWEEFYHYNNLIHETRLMADYITEIEIKNDNTLIYKGKIPTNKLIKAKSVCPALEDSKVYLRTECIENAIFKANFETTDFDLNKLSVRTQDYDAIFKSATDFVTELDYDGKLIAPEWLSAEPVGNICLLCGCSNGFLIPVYDAVSKKYAKAK